MVRISSFCICCHDLGGIAIIINYRQDTFQNENSKILEVLNLNWDFKKSIIAENILKSSRNLDTKRQKVKVSKSSQSHLKSHFAFYRRQFSLNYLVLNSIIYLVWKYFKHCVVIIFTFKNWKDKNILRKNCLRIYDRHLSCQLFCNLPLYY